MIDHDLLVLDAADWGRGSTVRLGVVRAFNEEVCRVRVRLSPNTLTDWIPWATWAAGSLRVWSPPAEGEQCMVLSPSGDLGQAIAVPAVFEQAGDFPAPSANRFHTVLKWSDGGYVRYERDRSRLIIHAPCIVKIEGDLLVTGDVYAGGVSLRQHKHGGVKKGGSFTKSPTGGTSPPCQ